MLSLIGQENPSQKKKPQIIKVWKLKASNNKLLYKLSISFWILWHAYIYYHSLNKVKLLLKNSQMWTKL